MKAPIENLKPTGKGIHFDIKPATKIKQAAPVVVEPYMVDVPVTMGFNWNDLPVGRVQLTKEAANLLTAGMVLSPAYETEPDHRLMGMGLIPAVNSIPPKEDNDVVVVNTTPAPSRYQGFLWHLFLIAVVAGLLAIIALIIRLNYIQA